MLRPLLIRAIVVDHEPLARRQLLHLLRNQADLEVAAELDTGQAAALALRDLVPDVAFLEIDLRDACGFEIIEQLERLRTLTVIMTATEGHAMRAFQAGAVAFLKKPIDRARLEAALDRVRQLKIAERLNALTASVCHEDRSPPRGFPDLLSVCGRLVAERAHRYHFIDLDAISHITSAANYITINVRGGGSYINRCTMKAASDALQPCGFLRIHNGTLMNVKHVSYAERISQAGIFAFILADGTRLVSGTTYRQAVSRYIRASQLGRSVTSAVTSAG